MSVNVPPMLTEEDLNDTDSELLQLLDETAIHPAWAADQIGVSRQYVTTRLTRLREHGHVDRPEKGFYVLADDPRDTEEATDA